MVFNIDITKSVTTEPDRGCRPPAHATTLGHGAVWLGHSVSLALLLCAAAPCLAQTPAPLPQPPLPAARTAAVPPPAPAGVNGVWIDHTGQGAVEVYECGAMLCGRVHWIRSPLDARGRPLADNRNPDAAKRGKPMCGLQIIGNAARQPNGAWDKGWIYNPEDGGTFDVELALRSPDTLQVRGYLGMKFLGETFLWKRAPATIVSCQIASNR